MKLNYSCIKCIHVDQSGECEVCEECMSGMGSERLCFKPIEEISNEINQKIAKNKVSYE